jgi:hypothetical protein
VPATMNSDRLWALGGWSRCPLPAGCLMSLCGGGAGWIRYVQAKYFLGGLNCTPRMGYFALERSDL